MQTTTSTKTQIKEFSTKFERDFSLVSCLSTSVVTRSAWYLENGASHHMTGAWEIFNSLTKKKLWIHLELGGDSKYVVKG